MFNKNFLLLVLGAAFYSIFFGCKSKSSPSDDNDFDDTGALKVDQYVVRKGHAVQDWRCDEVQFDRICHPNKWEVSDQKKRLFLTTINELDSNSFFTVVRYDVAANSINAEKYLRLMYSRLYLDTVEVFDSYTLKKLNFEHRTSYYGEFKTRINSVSYISLTMTLEFNGLLYDFALKTKESKKDEYYEIFQDILYNYRSNNKAIFSEKDDIKSFKEIDMSKI